MSFSLFSDVRFLIEKIGVDTKGVLDFNKKFEIQKKLFILNELNIFNIFKFIGQKYDYLWYIRGVFSYNIADIYYTIDAHKLILKNMNTSIKTEEINKSVKFFSDFKKKFNIKTTERLHDLIELYSSVLYFKNRKNILDFNILWKTIVDEKKHLEVYPTEAKKLFNN